MRRGKSRMWKARLKVISFSISIFSMLFWAYISARLVFSGPGVQPAHYFIDAFPSLFGIELTFLSLGIITFLVGFVFFVIYALLKESLSDEPDWREMVYWHALEALEEDPIYRALEDDKPPRGIA